MPKFTIIATDEENHVPRNGMREGIASLNAQTFKDFELLIIHDGPREGSYDYEITQIPDNTRFISTEKHYGIYGLEEFWAGYGWGHHSRDLGIKEASGDYIIHFNIDNILYPNALQTISDKIDKTGSEVVIFACKHKKFNVEYFSGIPPVMGKIDLLQCVASKNAWDSIGGWHRYDHSSDGYLFEEIIQRYGYVHIPEVLGENR
jgi:GT2 family glycosyltransferase